MDDALHDEAPELIPRPPQQEDVVGLCCELKDQGDLFFLRELFAAEGRKLPAE